MRSLGPLSRAITALTLVASGCTIAQPTPATQAPTTSPPIPPVASELTLFPDGIGPFTVGDDAGTVIEGITEVVGGWDADSIEEGSAIQVPTCEKGTARVVSWGSLALVFVTGSSSEIFASWSYGFDPVTGNSADLRGLDLRTGEDIGLGSTRGDLVAAYGSRVDITDAFDIQSATFALDGSSDRHLAGKLDAAGPSGVVDLLQIEPTC
ncbi:MAG: hypothetical protein BMS9Abin20_1175 [Acidimicrobiia bacterium]|nr:MAG: hypothetical protein BMS9Abin20_1175 [Acidimicrobiia bacterium]